MLEGLAGVAPNRLPPAGGAPAVGVADGAAPNVNDDVEGGLAVLLVPAPPKRLPDPPLVPPVPPKRLLPAGGADAGVVDPPPNKFPVPVGAGFEVAPNRPVVACGG